MLLFFFPFANQTALENYLAYLKGATQRGGQPKHVEESDGSAV